MSTPASPVTLVTSDNPAYRRRKRRNAVMMSLSALALAFGLFWLVWILAVLLWEGATALTPSLFMQMTPPPGSDGGLANAIFVAAINGGRHVNPTLAGHTVYAWSEILEKAELPGRRDLGALRIRTVGLKDQPGSGFPDKDAEGKYPDCVVLDLDYWVLMPRRP